MICVQLADRYPFKEQEKPAETACPILADCEEVNHCIIHKLRAVGYYAGTLRHIRRWGEERG